MTDLFVSVNDFLWSYILIAALIGCGLWFTWRTRFVQFRMVGEMVRLLGDSAKLATNGQRHISSFQAFAVSVATRVGTGNLAGVATAIAIGGPGAIFWMWLIALMGSATAFVESTLGQLFKQHHDEGFIGGPAYYIQRGLHCRWMSVLFAILLFAFSSIIGNYYYGEANIRFLTQNKTVMTVYRIFSAGVLVMFGALSTLEMVWSLGDLCMALLTACNLVAIVALGRYVFRLLDDYRRQKRQGIKDPVFHRHQLPEIEADIDCWE